MKKLGATLLAPIFLQAGECPPPWFTGPLLTPSAHVVPRGYINFEPYLSYRVRNGIYDADWKEISTPDFTRVGLFPVFYLGLTDSLEFRVEPRFQWQETRGVSNLVVEDVGIHFGYQIVHDGGKGNRPALKVYLQEIFPVGKFEKRSLSELGTDISGEGSYRTNLGWVIGQMLSFPHCHYLSLRFNNFVTLPTSVQVEGINFYGGAPDTDASIDPGITVTCLFGAEYNLTQNWALAIDLEGLYQERSSFTGFAGIAPDGRPAPLGLKEGFSFTFAPAIEYNFSKNLGLIGGVNFSFAGKNQPRFINGLIALNYFGPKKNDPKHRYRSFGGVGSGSGGR